MHNATRWSTAVLAIAVSGLLLAAGPITPATVAKPSIEAHAKPDFASPTVAKFSKDAPVKVSGQQGLWFQLALDGGKTGYVRVNDVRVAYGKAETAGAGNALFTGKAGKGRVSETASVRGINESTLKGASFDAAQLQLMESYRAAPEAAEQAAAERGWTATQVPYAIEYQPGKAKDGKGGSQAQKRENFGFARGLLSQVSGSLGSAVAPGEKLIGKSEQEVAQAELELGPLIAGRILGAAPLAKDPAMQQRVNLIGRWLASRSSRPDLPWTFGVIDDGEINAFAAPGGYILITRGLYQLLGSDDEVAAVLGHELSHVVQRDHYEVVRKQELQGAGTDVALSRVHTGGGAAGSLARGYVERNGAAIMLTSLDRSAEFRADQAAGIYLARAGSNPLAFYAVLQKMTALGSSSQRLTQLYKTHPSLDKRLDALDKQGYAGLEPYLDR
ncbi:MAG TPA: M48 family metalloprotease [Thermomonas sp.]|nr:M48 family metalloprotease [Thermomonas sp.]